MSCLSVLILMFVIFLLQECLFDSNLDLLESRYTVGSLNRSVELCYADNFSPLFFHTELEIRFASYLLTIYNFIFVIYSNNVCTHIRNVSVLNR